MFYKIFLVFLTLLFSVVALARGQVKLENDELFELSHGVGAFTLGERVNSLEARIKNIAKDREVNVIELRVEEFENSSNIVIGDRVVVTITERDAAAVSLTRQAFAKNIRDKLVSSIKDYRKINSWKKYALSVAYAIISTLILIFLLKFISRFFPAALSFVQGWSLKYIPSLQLKSYEILPASRIVELTLLAVRAIRLIVVLVLLYMYIPLIFSFFPYTSGWADKIFGYVANPLKNIAKVVIEYIPNLFFIGVILVLTNYLLKFLRFLFIEIEKGSLRFSGFYPEWATPTYKLVRFLVLIFALVVIFPYLPGSGSPAFQGVSVFVGVLLSLGSTSAISNIVGGVVLTYMRPFKIGDRVKIGDTSGDVVEKTLLVTRVRTTKNVDVTVPNAMVLSNHLINYSAVAAGEGLLIHSTVTIGYDVDWRLVHKLLIDAAGQVEGIKASPSPFVLQTSLDDFYVSYEINAYTNQPKRMALLYSELHKNIQENFKEAKVEIMSPHFSALRDGSQMNIPAEGREPIQFLGPIRVSTNNSTT